MNPDQIGVEPSQKETTVSRSKTPKRITPRMLNLTNACSEQLNLFSKTFPDGIEVTRANLIAAAAAGLDIEWGAEEFLTASAFTKYAVATSEADRVYDDTYSVAEEAYQKAIKAGEDIDAARQSNVTACEEAGKVYNITVAPILADVLGLP